MKHVLTVFALIVSTINLLAQESTIRGHIYQTDSLSPIVGASVYLSKTKYGAFTNGNGNYQLENLPQGEYTLIVAALGYTTIKKEIKITTNEKQTFHFILTESILNLPTVTIIGGTIGLKEIPGSVQYLSPKELEKFSYTDINRTLRAVPGVNLQEEDGFGLFPSIGLRGTGVERSTKIALMEDGILIAPAPYAAPAAYYFPTIARMQGVEIIKGSSQIKYGPYTTGGAINLISTQIPSHFSGKINLIGGSFGSKNLHTVIGDSYKQISYLVETVHFSATGFKQIDNLHNSTNTLNSGFAKQDYLAKLQFTSKANARFYQSVLFKVGQTNGAINETYLGLTQEDFKANPYRRYAGSQVDNIQLKQNQFTITHTIKIHKNSEITTTVYRTSFARNWYKLNSVKDSTGTRIKISNLLENPTDNKDAFSILTGKTSINSDALAVKANNRTYYSKGVQTNFKNRFKTGKLHHLSEIGLRIHQDQIDRFQWVDEFSMENGVMKLTKAGIAGTESNRIETANAIASYIQHRIKIKKLTITVGLRYENITQNRLDYGKNDPSRTGNSIKERKNAVAVFIPGIGVDYKFNNHISTFAGIHKGFAPPGSKEGLKPEESINYEIGGRYSKNTLKWQAVLFLNAYTNLLGADLQAAGGNGTNDLFNGGEVQTKGIEFTASYDLWSFKKRSGLRLPISVVYTFTNSKFLNDFESDFEGWGEVSAGDNFPYLAQNQFTVMLGLNYKKFGFTISGKYMDAMRTSPGQGTIPTNQKTDAYFVVDASANYKLHKNITFFANSTNITNQKYIVARRPAGLRPGMPLALNIGIKARF